MSLKTTINHRIAIDYSSIVSGVTGRFQPSFGRDRVLENGTGLNQASVVYYEKSKSINATTNYDIDLSGVKVDAFGASATFTKVKKIYIENFSVVVGDVIEIGGAGSNEFLLFKASGDIYELGPGGEFSIVEPSLAGLPVTAGTGDILRIRNASSNVVECGILIVGV